MLSRRRWLIAAVCAVIGMACCLLIAAVLQQHSKRFTAQATLAMLPASYIPTSQAADYWEVLNHGQATRSASIVFGQGNWLDAAAAAAGVPTSELTLSAGAVRDTTLIDVTVEANSPETAEAALSSVLTDASGPATAVSGPFRLEVVKSPAGSAQSLSPSGLQTFGAAGIVGLLLGSGAGLLLSRWATGKSGQGRNHDRTAKHAAASRTESPGDPDTAPLHSETPPR